MQLCSKPRGARGVEPETFRRRGQLLSCPPTTGPKWTPKMDTKKDAHCAQHSVQTDGADAGLRGCAMTHACITRLDGHAGCSMVYILLNGRPQNRQCASWLRRIVQGQLDTGLRYRVCVRYRCRCRCGTMSAPARRQSWRNVGRSAASTPATDTVVPTSAH